MHFSLAEVRRLTGLEKYRVEIPEKASIKCDFRSAEQFSLWVEDSDTIEYPLLNSSPQGMLQGVLRVDGCSKLVVHALHAEQVISMQCQIADVGDKTDYTPAEVELDGGEYDDVTDVQELVRRELRRHGFGLDEDEERADAEGYEFEDDDDEGPDPDFGVGLGEVFEGLAGRAEANRSKESEKSHDGGESEDSGDEDRGDGGPDTVSGGDKDAE